MTPHEACELWGKTFGKAFIRLTPLFIAGPMLLVVVDGAQWMSLGPLFTTGSVACACLFSRALYVRALRARGFERSDAKRIYDRFFGFPYSPVAIRLAFSKRFAPLLRAELARASVRSRSSPRVVQRRIRV